MPPSRQCPPTYAGTPLAVISCSLASWRGVSLEFRFFSRGCPCFLCQYIRFCEQFFKQAKQTSCYVQQSRFIPLSWSVFYEHVHVLHEYTQTLAASSAAQHLLCWVCCLLSVLFKLPSVHPGHQAAWRHRWLPILFGIGRALLIVFLLLLFVVVALTSLHPPPPSGELSLLLRGYEDNMQETRSVTLLAQNA